MRLPITEQFLWLLYALYEITDDVFDIFRLPRNIHQALAWSDRGIWKNLRRMKQRRQFAQFVYNLKKQGLIKVIGNGAGQYSILLTKKGQQKALRAYFINLKERGLRKRSDGKFIMVIFDIPEKLRKVRDEFRDCLYMLGFKQLQKSVWVCPFDIKSQIDKFIDIFRIDKFVRIFLVKEIEA